MHVNGQAIGPGMALDPRQTVRKIVLHIRGLDACVGGNHIDRFACLRSKLPDQLVDQLEHEGRVFPTGVVLNV